MSASAPRSLIKKCFVGIEPFCQRTFLGCDCPAFLGLYQMVFNWRKGGGDIEPPPAKIENQSPIGAKNDGKTFHAWWWRWWGYRPV